MRRYLTVILSFVFIFALAACGSVKDEQTEGKSSSETLVVYSPHQNEIINPMIKEFEDRTDIKVDVVTGGTGELLSRVQAEAENPGADVFWGGGAESLESFGDSFEPYKSKEDASIPEQYKSADHIWTGFSALPMVIFYNQDMVSESEAPSSWADLLDEKWKGKIAFTDPEKSGSSYTQLVTMLTAFQDDGEEGWGYIKDFVEGIDGKLLSSSSMVPKGVADGEFPVGITLEEAAYRYVAGGAAVNVRYPSEGTSAVPDGVAMIKGAKNKENAETFIDFLVGEDAQEMIVTEFNRRSIRDDIDPPAGLMASEDIPLVDYDFNWSANNKDAVMDEFKQIIISR